MKSRAFPPKYNTPKLSPCTTHTMHVNYVVQDELLQLHSFPILSIFLYPCLASGSPKTKAVIHNRSLSIVVRKCLPSESAEAGKQFTCKR